MLLARVVMVATCVLAWGCAEMELQPETPCSAMRTAEPTVYLPAPPEPVAPVVPERSPYSVPRAKSRSLGFIGDRPLTPGRGRYCGRGRCDNLVTPR